MPYTDNFKRQHQELLGLVGELATRTKVDPGDAKGLRTLLSALSGKLTVHLAMEDKALYPRLVQVDADNSRGMARAFQQEMGGLADSFAQFNLKWQATAIAADPGGFAQATKALASALGKRIARENAELYPLADRVL